ncbi:SH3 domain [Nakaseomyces glabratus]|nr:SH3 domain [Nakaseomyces glabratus]KAH7605365.1 SH3 domain [Nakaseomyces glabratus]KAH7614371.1 SH3 domain [Nakaseomyces glabratus]
MVENTDSTHGDAVNPGPEGEAVEVVDDLHSYISIKDYAYDESNALHYGYLEEEEPGEAVQEHDNYAGSDAEDGEDIDGNHTDKRASVVMPQDYVVNQKAVALYDFEPENDNELGLKEGDVIFISYRHCQGWLVAQNDTQTKTGLVPEEFVSYLDSEESDSVRPFYLTEMLTHGLQAEPEQDAKAGKKDDDEDEWEDIDQLESDMDNKLNISVS